VKLQSVSVKLQCISTKLQPISAMQQSISVKLQSIYTMQQSISVKLQSIFAWLQTISGMQQRITGLLQRISGELGSVPETLLLLFPGFAVRPGLIAVLPEVIHIASAEIAGSPTPMQSFVIMIISPNGRQDLLSGHPGSWCSGNHWENAQGLLPRQPAERIRRKALRID